MAGQAAKKEGERQGDFVGGKYLLEECLGIGGMGEVYRATNVSLGRKVAIKLLNKEHTSNEDDVLRFLREARAAAAVRHPNVVDVFDVARDDDGTPFIVQELLDGEDLEQFLGGSRDGRISAAEALEVMIPVAEAVAAAHARDVVHRDLKPANIYLAREGTRIIPKVLDFGACLYQTVGVLSAKERRMLIGTPHYMAPEQITTAMDVDARADVWAMGVILYEMLVGETPFEAPEAHAVLKLVKTRAVPLLRKLAPEAPERLEELVQRCLDRDRRKRFATVVAVRDELVAIRRELEQAARGKSEDTRPDVFAAIEPKSNVLKAAKKQPAVDAREDIVDLDRRIPSLVLRGGKSAAPRRGSSLLNLSAPDDEVSWDTMPPHSASRPIEAAKPVAPVRQRTAADVLREADAASHRANDVSSRPPPPSSPPRALSSFPPVLAPPSWTGAARAAPVARMDLDIDPVDSASIDLDLGPSSRRDKPATISSIPPVLDPRASTTDGRRSERPPPVVEESLPLTPPLAPSSRVSRTSSSLLEGEALPRSSAARSSPAWSATANATFGLAVVVPGTLAFFALRHAPTLLVPLGEAMRGASPLASGVLAVVTLVAAAALATKTVGASRSHGMLVATAFAVLFGIVMIIVTFAASETAELQAPPAVAGLAPLIAPIVPLALGYLALRRSRSVWLSVYERREGVLFALLASALLFAALELGPVGAVRVSAPAVAPALHSPRAP